MRGTKGILEKLSRKERKGGRWRARERGRERDQWRERGGERDVWWTKGEAK